MNEERAELERSVREACEAKSFDVAATRALEAYSPEILSFLYARLRTQSDRDEVYAQFAEELWSALPQFEWRCSLRTYAYTLARNAASRYKRAEHNQRERRLPLSRPGSLSALIDRERSRTQVHLRSTVKGKFRALREQFEPDDQMLLILRIDREMAWRDIAITLSGDPDLAGEAATRDGARLRKRFERLKVELRQAAEAAGLLDPDSE
jgi:RNA polymerase sigma-70 factor (ECF subfamily)